jgi:hypothetical protein
MRVLRCISLAACAALLLGAGGAWPARAQDPEPTVGQGLLDEDPAALEQMPKASTFRAFLPPSIDLAADFPPPGDQGRTQMCVGWSTGYALRSYLERKRRHVDLSEPGNRFSPYFVYTQIAPNCNSGAKISEALMVQSQVGALPIRDYGVMDCNRPPAPADKARAVDYRIGNFRVVRAERPDDVKGELAHGRPVVFGMLINRSFMRLKGDDIYDVPPDKPLGGHAMVLIGYDDSRQAFRVMNSWGPEWGDRGYGWISYRAFAAGTHAAFTVDGAPAAEEPAPPAPGPAAVVPPTPSPTPQRTQPVPAAVVTPAPAPPAPRQTLAQLVETLSCARLEMLANGAVRGFVGTEDDRQRLAAAGVATQQIAVAPWPQCEAMLTLWRALATEDGLEAAIAAPSKPCPSGALCEGDRLVAQVRMPRHPAHLYVAYVQANGDMVMLEQPGGAAPAPRLPGTVVNIGQGAGQPEYRVSGPFGREMLIFLAAASPLFDKEVEQQMTEREFLTLLRKALIYKPRASDPDRVVSAAVLPLTTAAR